MSDVDLQYMRLALREARKGLGRTSPNPCVGAVVVRDGRVVAKGHHRRAGEAHAEVNALAAAGETARGATLYVTLEPCNHSGRTPPCTQAILASGIRRVVAGMADPNPRVAGGGGAFLASRGVEVRMGVLARECRALNYPFLKHSITGLPWVILKAGASLDGRIAVRPGRADRITGEEAHRLVHRLRDRVDAILVGSTTALVDDPSLTARPAGRRGNDPLRVVLDSRLRLPVTARMLVQDSAAATWVFCGDKASRSRQQALENAGAIVHRLGTTAAGELDLAEVLAHLGQDGVTSLLVEGGGRVHGAFLRAGLADELKLFLAPLVIGAGGVPLVADLGGQRLEDCPRLLSWRSRRCGDDLLLEGLLPPASRWLGEA